ncbi:MULTISPECIES: TetR/AcrR family transcriptional regulator [unclassified Streptomyces]|uniref:TetR/AcrR family transcriptional regulator n=1 Tax=unclassified Streptomyces TaxID=2593676 RepID=UPI000DBA784F|nr:MULTISPECIES: TetR/AcrR family transcriptional regulator [unclassified Streptomyces]MYT72157.1 TetR family transcriptional regulator [Streptomyces sp. SID8367]RAJ81568.1 TetR family transcriptional regulator [Streptomyces sp. PsTaAH-137]
MTSGTSSTTETSGSGDLRRTLDLLWGTGDAPRRGPRPALSLDRIVTTAVAVADAEGIAAVSMRRLSQELGTGTMSLYRYVPGKAELLDLMLDKVQTPYEPGEHPNALGEKGSWRAAVETAARETLALYQRHPWLLQVNQARPVLGPGALAGMEKMLSRIRPMGLSDPELLSVLIMIDGYVSGAARTRVHEQEAERTTGMTDTDFWAAQGPALEAAMASGRYPVMASLSEDTFGPGFDHFEFGLQRLLDGLDVLVAARRSG